jgi:hypothetical protein
MKKKDIKITQFNKEVLKELINIKPKAYSRAKQLFPNIEIYNTPSHFSTFCFTKHI